MRDRGDLPGSWRNIRRSRRPLGRTLRLIALNLYRRFVPLPPRPCCGHDGEPGC